MGCEQGLLTQTLNLVLKKFHLLHEGALVHGENFKLVFVPGRV
jgi:hypothetical protein